MIFLPLKLGFLLYLHVIVSFMFFNFVPFWSWYKSCIEQISTFYLFFVYHQNTLGFNKIDSLCVVPPNALHSTWSWICEPLLIPPCSSIKLLLLLWLCLFLWMILLWLALIYQLLQIVYLPYIPPLLAWNWVHLTFP